MKQNDYRSLRIYGLPIFFIGTLAILAGSCENSNPGKTEAQLKKADSLRKDSIHSIQLKQEIAALDSEITACENELVTLRKKFDVVHDLCFEKTYCHKNFWGAYTQRDHNIVCGVDTLGQLFMVANTYEGWLTDKQYKMYDQSDIEMVVLDSTFTTMPGIIYHSAFTKDSTANAMYVCACAPVQRIFLNGSDRGILRAIALHPQENIRFYFKYNDKKISPQFILSARYKKGIAESVALSDLMIRRKKLEAEKAAKTKKPREHS